MHSTATATAILASLVTLAAGHGFVNDPPARRPGSAYQAACGQQPFSQQSADINGNVQGIEQVVGSDLVAADCNLWLCKGFQFADNEDNVQSFAAGQEVAFDVTIAAPHTGFANVSVVSTSSNTVIGEPLIEFTNYASNSGVDANNTAFSVTIPSDLGGQCATAGDCVLQWFWDAPDVDQSYEACIDFTVDGAGNGGGSTPTSVSTPSVPEPTAAPSTTVAPAPSSVVSPTTTPLPGDDDDEEIPDDECPADDEEDGELPDDGEGDDEDEEEDPVGAPGPIISTVSNAAVGGTTVTSVVTVTATSEPVTVTVTAEPTQCI